MSKEIEAELREVTNADHKAAGWIERRNAAIARAHQKGASYREIADVCSLSHMSVKRILEQENK